MTSVGLLAACGLLYAIASNSPVVPAERQEIARQAVAEIAAQVTDEQLPQFTRAVEKLREQLLRYPSQVDQLADAVGAQCQVLGGVSEAGNE